MSIEKFQSPLFNQLSSGLAWPGSLVLPHSVLSSFSEPSSNFETTGPCFCYICK